LIYFFIALVIFSMVAMIGPMVYFEYHNTIERSANEVSVISLIQKERISDLLVKYTDYLTDVRDDINFAGLAPGAGQTAASGEAGEEINREFEHYLARFWQMHGLVVTAADGALLAAAGDADFKNELLDPALAQLRRQPFKKISVIDVAGRSRLITSMEIKSGEQVLGVLSAIFKIDELENIVHDYTGLGETGETLLAYRLPNGAAQYLNSRRYEQQAVVGKVVAAEDKLPIITALNNRESQIKFASDYRGQSVLAATRYLEKADWGLVTKIDRYQIFQPFYQIAYVIAIVLFLLVIGGGLLSYFLSRTFTIPLYRLIKIAEKIKKNEFDFTSAVNLPLMSGEFGLMAETFDEMVAAIKQSRSGIESKINEQTQEIITKQQEMESQKTAILNVLEDVEEEKTSAQIERDKNQLILQSIGDAVFALDANRRIILFNQVAVNLTGYSASEAIGKRYDDIIKFIDERGGAVIDFIETVYTAGQVVKMPDQIVLIRKDKTRIPVDDSAAPVKNAAGEVTGCVVVFRDVSREREVDRMKSEFISVTSHHLRTPLTAIRWYIEELYNGELGKINAEQKDYLSQVIESNWRMIKLVNDLLNISRLETGRLTISPEPTSVVELIERTVKEHLPLAKAKNCGIVFAKPQKTVPKISIDGTLIGQVIDNLVSNAVKYSTGVGRGCSVAIKLEVSQTDIIVSVKDQGVGIPKKDQHRVFERFFRADNVVRMETEGTGLGLYIAKMVVEASAGRIWFESDEKKGSTFYFSLPLVGSKFHQGETRLTKI